MLVKKSFDTAKWGNPRVGYLAYPDDESKKYPLELFFHGLGQSVDQLKTEGPLTKIANGQAPRHITLALNGEGKHAGYAPEVSQFWYVANNDPDIKRLWDGKTILWTGLSAGGFRTLEALAQGMPGVFAPMSPVLFDTTKIDFNKIYRTWFFHASNDTNAGTPYTVSENLYKEFNKRFPGSSRLTTYLGGHSGWNTFYAFDYKDENYGDSLYTWAFGNSTTPPTSTTTSTSSTTTTTRSKKLVKTVTTKFFDDFSTETEEIG